MFIVPSLHFKHGQLIFEIWLRYAKNTLKYKNNPI